MKPIAVAALCLAAGWIREDPEALFARGEKLLVARDAKAALPLLEQAYQKLPGGAPLRAIAAYDAACALALLGGKADDAFAWLERAVAAGFGSELPRQGQPTMAEHAKADADLAALRTDPRFEKFLRDVASNTRRTEEAAKAAPEEIATPLFYQPDSLRDDQEAPLLVLLHGGRSNKSQFLERWKPVAADLGVRLVSVSGGVFVSAGQFGWFRGPADRVAMALPEIQKRLAAAVDAAAQRWKVDRSRVVLAGFSQGAGVALVAAAEERKRFCGALLVLGDLSRAEAEKRFDAAGASSIPIAQIVGTQDEECAPTQRLLDADLAARRWPHLLREADVTHDFTKIPAADLTASVRFLLNPPVASRPR